MTLKEEYKKEQCKNCKNREKGLCRIKTTEQDEVKIVKCEAYESTIEKRKKLPSNWQWW